MALARCGGKASSAMSCAKNKACVWIASPGQALVARGARCYPRATVAHWACGSLTAAFCALNPACRVQSKMCVVRTPS